MVTKTYQVTSQKLLLQKPVSNMELHEAIIVEDKDACERYCPVIIQDRQSANNSGYLQAQQDLDRHIAASKGCEGAQVNSSRCVIKCPLFGVEAEL